MKYEISCHADGGAVCIQNDSIVYRAEKDMEQAYFSMEILFPQWEEDCYVMMPACAYNGNRIRRVVRSYPPMYRPEETKEHLMTDVPALNPDGSGVIEVTSGDMAVPCVGIFSRHAKQGFFLFTEQEVKGKNLGFTLEKGRLNISYPANRSDIYRFCRPHESGTDKGISVVAGEELASAYQIHTFPCEDIPEFYAHFFKLRKCVMHDGRAPFLYTKELWDIMETYFNDHGFDGNAYTPGSSKEWQPGWVGGGISSYPLLAHGTPLSKKRAAKTLDYLVSLQAPSGFYHGFAPGARHKDDSFSTPGMEGLHMVRKSADALYFLLKHFALTEPEPAWKESAKKCADAFVKLYNTYGTFGQFVNIETGEMVISGTASGAMAPAALAKAWAYFGEDTYLTCARASLEHYWQLFLETGITNGGPGEILSAPDSESAFALLESCVVLYETDKNEKWLAYAETAAQYCSSWVVTYAYQFPEGSEFHRLRINTVGSVFANVQNKHSAPGICTLSGDSLLKLYRYTKNDMYLELIKDIAYFIPQCVSTKEQPIYTWDNPPKKLPEGFICERVNMSDWEGDPCIGGVFYASCWCDASLTLSFAELMTQEEMLP